MELLAAVCYVIIGFCIIMYVLLDGFDLGIGILFPFFNSKHRNIMISTILPVWDGNQTWLVLGVAVFYGAFPRAFSELMPLLYLPLLTMVVALLLRGITFEFRIKEEKYRTIWDYVFFVSSFTATVIQGLLLGCFVKGFQLTQDGVFTFTLFTPFNIACAVSLIFGYTLLGSTWIIGKTTNSLQEKMYRFALPCLALVIAALGLICLWTPYVDPEIWQRWYAPDAMKKVFWLPVITGVLIYLTYSNLKLKHSFQPYPLTIGIFLCAYLGFAISTWPYIIPHKITMWDAASPPASQLFLIIGALLLIPVLVIYTSYAYYIFRGKVTEEIEYH